MKGPRLTEGLQQSTPKILGSYQTTLLGAKTKTLPLIEEKHRFTCRDDWSLSGNTYMIVGANEALQVDKFPSERKGYMAPALQAAPSLPSRSFQRLFEKAAIHPRRAKGRTAKHLLSKQLNFVSRLFFYFHVYVDLSPSAV